MGRSVYITTPIPTLEEVGKSLKMSKARQKRLIEIIRGVVPSKPTTRHRDMARSSTGRVHARKNVAVGTMPSKKTKRAAVS